MVGPAGDTGHASSTNTLQTQHAVNTLYRANTLDLRQHHVNAQSGQTAATRSYVGSKHL